MARYFLKLQYDGTPFHGWQKQDNAISVQEKLEESLAVILSDTISVTGCGRTDTGVHALEYFAHFDYSELLNAKSFLIGMNAILPHEIAVLALIPVGDDCHARFDAISRTYIYKIITSKRPMLRHYACLRFKMPNQESLQYFADKLLPFENFKAFAKKGGNQKNYECKISEAKWTYDDGIYEFRISANRFLRNMVRAVVGTLLEASKDNWSDEKFNDIILSNDRSVTGASVPASGLHLSKIIYPYIENDTFVIQQKDHTK